MNNGEFRFLTAEEAQSLRDAGFQLVRSESSVETVFIDANENTWVKLHCDGMVDVRGPMWPKLYLTIAPIVERIQKRIDAMPKR